MIDIAIISLIVSATILLILIVVLFKNKEQQEYIEELLEAQQSVEEDFEQRLKAIEQSLYLDQWDMYRDCINLEKNIKRLREIENMKNITLNEYFKLKNYYDKVIDEAEEKKKSFRHKQNKEQ